jgi:pimeloyl-ACP methyl ester carboxylesterase
MTPPTTTAQLAHALAAYQAEARHGTFAAPHYRMRTVTWGQGPPLLFIHGLADQVRSFAMLMHQLQHHFTCVGIALADGESDGAKIRGYRHRHHVEDFYAFTRHMGWHRFDVFGSSYGSTITLRYLATHPHHVGKVILQGGFARRPLIWPERGLARLARYWPGRMDQAPGRYMVMGRFDRPQFEMAPPEVYRFFLECSGDTPIQAAARRGVILNTLDLRPMLPFIPHHVFMIGGDRDAVVPRASEATLEVGLKSVSRVEYAPCGHYPQYTHAGTMAQDMLKHLSGA